jgi:hypothetical protein
MGGLVDDMAALVGDTSMQLGQARSCCGTAN